MASNEQILMSMALDNQMRTSPNGQELSKMLWANIQQDASDTKVPTQAQLRILAHSLDTANLLAFEFISDENEIISPAEILTKLQNLPAGVERDTVWSCAEDFNEMGMDVTECFDPDRDWSIPKGLKHEAFPLFNEFPLELRDKIWKHAVESNHLVEIIWQKEEQRWWASKSSQVGPPGVFATCRESREATKFVRENCGINAFGTWTNIYSDLLWMNTLQDILNRRFMNFCMNLYEVWKDPIRSNDDDIGDSEDRPLSKLPRLAVSWDMWEGMLNRGEMDDDLSVGGEEGLLRTNFTSLKEMVLVDVEDVRDQGGKLYRDDRLLVEGELLEAQPTQFLTDPTSALEKARENLKFEPGQCEVILRRLLRGNDGPGGARSEYLNRDQSFMGMVTSLLQLEEGTI
ncbi:uncharacterized protein PAC_09201 [Phialocephala subalpina]|uniref:2EXR domain-containing protein n=1 Tax=Phialocephala subalpina TaxID=576137 RepID=A0A1L7X2Q1_9HELO|nr:uncharacterized protein PAC_09201 [Phialocephala subalpina]